MRPPGVVSLKRIHILCRKRADHINSSRMRIAAYAAGAELRLKERRMLLSNRKLTTEEKIAKSKLYAENMEKTQNRLKDMREAKRKLDAEIADELEKAEMVTNQAVGKMFRSRIKDDLPLEKYGEIIEFMFLHEDCAEFIAEVTKKYRQEQEKAKLA